MLRPAVEPAVGAAEVLLEAAEIIFEFVNVVLEIVEAIIELAEVAVEVEGPVRAIPVLEAIVVGPKSRLGVGAEWFPFQRVSLGGSTGLRAGFTSLEEEGSPNNVEGAALAAQFVIDGLKASFPSLG